MRAGLIKSFVFIVLGIFTSIEAEPIKVSLKSDSAVLMSADTGTVLYKKNAHKVLSPASITKVATAMYALKQKGLNLDVMVEAKQDLVGWVSADKKKKSNYTLPAYWLEPGATHISIKAGEKVPLRDLFYGMMVASADECSNMIADHVGSSVDGFMEGLNGFIKEELGCCHTHFSNPHGLYHPDHRTTAYDMALITKEALKDPFFCKMVKTLEYKRKATCVPAPAPLWQTNRLVKPGKYYYKKAIGVKTGYISHAQNTLVAAAKDQGRTLIAVLMNCDERSDIFADAIKLFEAAFMEPQMECCFVKKGKQSFVCEVCGGSNSLQTFTKENLSLFYYPSDGVDTQCRCLLKWHSLQAPVVRGQAVGELILQGTDGNNRSIVVLYAQNDVAVSQTSQWMKRLRKWGPTVLEGVALVSVLTLLGGLSTQLYRKKHK